MGTHDSVVESEISQQKAQAHCLQQQGAGGIIEEGRGVEVVVVLGVIVGVRWEITRKGPEPNDLEVFGQLDHCLQIIDNLKQGKFRKKIIFLRFLETLV